MTGCGAVYVAEFGVRPELDRLERCTREDCAEHDRQLAWLRATGRLLAYADQIARFERGDRGGVAMTTPTLEPPS